MAPLVVFSKSYCPYCNSTKSTLTSLGAEFTAYELDHLRTSETSPVPTVSSPRRPRFLLHTPVQPQLQ